jgi:hypothetical protein
MAAEYFSFVCSGFVEDFGEKLAETDGIVVKKVAAKNAAYQLFII